MNSGVHLYFLVSAACGADVAGSGDCRLLFPGLKSMFSTKCVVR